MTAIDHYLLLVQPYLDQYGYAAIFAILLMESMGLPLPGETVLISASLVASQGKMSLPFVIATGWCATVLGDNIGFAIGRFGGRRLIGRYGSRVGITEQKLQRAEDFFARYGPELVLAARFIVVVRQLNGIIAGSAGMRWRQFLLYNVIGATLWVSVWTLGIYYIGSHLAVALPWIQRGGYVLAAAIVIFLVYWCIRKRKAKHKESSL